MAMDKAKWRKSPHGWVYGKSPVILIVEDDKATGARVLTLTIDAMEIAIDSRRGRLTASARKGAETLIEFIQKELGLLDAQTH